MKGKATMNLMEALKASAAEARREKDAENKPKMLPAAQKMRILEAAERFAEMAKGPRFKVGDWVTPVKDAPVYGVGDPHMVVEVRSCGPDFEHDDPGSWRFGAHWDTRMLGFDGQSDAFVAAAWVESAFLEPWIEP
jgi:hypothetical protein